MDCASTIGNIGHILNISFILFYGAIVFLFGQEQQQQNRGEIIQDEMNESRNEHHYNKTNFLIDRRWEKEGFCSPEDTTIDQTHFDSGVVLSVVSFLFILFLYSKNRRNSKTTATSSLSQSLIVTATDAAADGRMMKTADTYMYYAILGVVGHAAGHFLIYYSKANGVYPDGEIRGIDDLKATDSILLSVFKILPGYALFWVPLLKSYMQNTRWSAIAALALLAVVGSLHLPIKFGFSFAQCFFFLSLSLDQLFFVDGNKKNFAYALYPFLTVLPSIILSLLECTSCSSHTLWRRYGHTIYDAFMGSSYALFYGICSIKAWMGESASPPTKKSL